MPARKTKIKPMAKPQEEPIAPRESIEKETAPEAAMTPARRKDWILPVSIVLAAVLVGGALVFSALYRPGAASNPSGGNGNAQSGNGKPSAAALAAALALTSRDVVLGNANAPVTVIEYGDYQCPFCTRYATQFQPMLVKNYINDGKVKFVFRDFPFLDRFQGLPAGANESHDAGIAAECAKDQGRFWQFHDALYAAKAADEAKGGGENDGLYNKSLFSNIASRVAMNLSTFASCLASGKYTATVDNDYANAVAIGVNSTPTTFVNGAEVVDANGNSVGADTTAITAAINAALKG